MQDAKFLPSDSGKAKAACACDSNKKELMKNPSHTDPEEENSQLGSTDQIEQRAAVIAKEEDHAPVTNEDRKEALDEMLETSPIPTPKPDVG